MQRLWVEEPPTAGGPLQSAWAPGQGTFESPQDLVFVRAGNPVLTRRLTPMAAYEVMVKARRGGYPSRCGLLVHPQDLHAAMQELTATEVPRARRPVSSQRRRELREATHR